MTVVEDSFQAMQGMPDYASAGGADAAGSSFDLRSMVGVLLRRWKLVLAIPVMALILTSVGLSFVAPKYRSIVEILAADPKRQTNVADERRLSTLDVDAAAMASELAVISSKSVALRAARELGLENGTADSHAAGRPRRDRRNPPNRPETQAPNRGRLPKGTPASAAYDTSDRHRTAP